MLIVAWAYCFFLCLFFLGVGVGGVQTYNNEITPLAIVNCNPEVHSQSFINRVHTGKFE